MSEEPIFTIKQQPVIKVAFKMGINREMNDHSQLYGRFLPNQHDMGAITGLPEALSGINTKEGNLSDLTTDAKNSLVSAINEVDLHADNNASAISDLQAGKADKATTLAGYGITNAYTKSEVDTALSGKQNNLTTAQMTAVNSGIDSTKVEQISTNASDITALQSGKADKSTTYTKTEVDTIASGKANVGLDNLNANGQMIVDSVDGKISNCILEIPQNIKLELSNNVLTLKSGSVITQTGSTYATTTITSDRTTTISQNGTYEVFCLNNGAAISYYNRIDRIGSGSSLPADSSEFSVFFNTTDKLIYLWYNNEWIVWVVSYPLCVVKVENGSMSFAKDSNGNDMIFNGAGFIGHHAFVYPNVKALIPNGFNDDGSLASILRTNDSLRIFELDSGRNSLTMSNFSARFALRKVAGEVDNLSEITENGIHHYVKSLNLDYYKSSGSYYTEPITPFINYAYDGTTVTDFTIRQPVRLATTEMLDKVQDQVDTNTTAISGKAGLADNNTFTGGNTFRGQINQQTSASESGTTYYTYINQKVTNIDYTTNPSYNGYYYGIMFRDKNDKALAFTTYGYGTAGNSNYTITVKTRNADNSADVESSIAFNIARNGSASFTIPAPTQDNTTSTQADTVGARNTKLASLFTSITGYDASKAQTLHHDNSGNMTWIDD